MAVLTTSQLEQLYLAYFGRPADFNGLVFYTSNPSNDIWSVAAAFSASPESKALYGNFGASAINAIYQNLFNRDAEAAGLTYWSTEVAAGRLTAAGAAYAILLGAQNDDKVTVTNKMAVSAAFTTGVDTAAEIIGYSGDAAAATARAFLKTVTSTAASVTAALAGLDAAIASTTTGGTVGTSLTLTTSQDVLTGTNFNDTFNAPAIADSVGTLHNSLQNVDQITGGGGTDTLNVTLNDAATVAPSLSSVENVAVRFTNAAAKLDLTSATGVTSVAVGNSTTVGEVDKVGAASLAVNNQTVNATFDGVTSTTLNLGFDTAGTSTAQITVDLAWATASTAAALAITANNGNVILAETTASTGVTGVTVAGTGANKITFSAADSGTITSLTTTGAGSVNVSGTALTKLATVTAGDGGVKLDATGDTATSFTATTGAGKDTLTVTGGIVKTVTTGAGDDKVTTATSGLAATSAVSLGAGNDTLTLGAVFTAGATMDGGDGTDTFGMAKAVYTAVSALTAAQRALVTNFEVLSISDAVTTGDTIDLSKITGITSFKAAAGVTTATTANVTNVGANATIELAGAGANNGTLIETLKTDTSADVLTLKLNKDFADNNDTTADVNAYSEILTAADIETLNVVSTGNQTVSPLVTVSGYKADTVTNTLDLTGSNKLTSVVVTGDQKLVLASTAAMTKLATVDGSANTGGLNFDGHLADMTTPTTSVAMTITGSATAANTLVGTGHNDTITGGAKADTITGGAGGDTLTGGAGNDTFVFAAGDSIIGTGTFDTITDFKANTFGAGTAGAVDTHGAFGVVSTSLTGDLIKIAANTAAATDIIKTFVASSASDAATFLATNKAAATVTVALDASTGNLYIDNVGSDGVADLYIHLTGVTTIDAAAILLV